jgi:uncharacterized protein YecT (DUF1311 family)
MLLALMCLLPLAKAYANNVLEACIALSPQVNDIHICLDNYLDDMDKNIAEITAVIENEMSGESLAAFAQAQQAFTTYRRRNCLWYLQFSSPRSEAEQIAKNCLINMSQQRLSELQSLLDADSNEAGVLQGYYVYGADRNSFWPCGMDSRYWVEGENTVVSELQQGYLNQAITDLQVLYAVLKGDIDTEEQTRREHEGVFTLTEVKSLRVPRETDCNLPSNVRDSATVRPLVTQASNQADVSGTDPGTADTVKSPDNDEPEQQLRAYFGDWLVDCVQQKTRYECELKVSFHDATPGLAERSASTGVSGSAPTLIMHRQAHELTSIQLQFPGVEIDSPTRIRWRIDGFTFDIPGSHIRVDEVAARQLVTEPQYIKEELLPLMIKGGQLGLEVVEDVDDPNGQAFVATLKGVTRALAFADDFVSGQSQ